jgi:hypothetical protein
VEEETVVDELYDYGDGKVSITRTRTSTIGECGEEEPLEREAASCIFSP